MTTASPVFPDHKDTSAIVAQRDNQRNRQTVEAMVDGFASQDLDGIMTLIADDAVYCDIVGKGTRGDEYSGKNAIRRAFARQFDLGGKHTYLNPKIIVEGECAFASWTMVIGDPADPKAPRFEGIDEFSFNAQGQIKLKKAWLKGQPRLKRVVLWNNPAAVIRNFRYLLSSITH